MISAGTEGQIHHTVFLIWVKDRSPGRVLERSGSHETPKDTVCVWLKGKVPEGTKQLPEISGADRDFSKR